MDRKRHTHGSGQQHKSKPGHTIDSTAATADHNVKLSRTLSKLLRHGAPSEKVTIHPGGFLDVEEVLKLQRFIHWSVDDIKSVVQNNDKQRFTLKDEEGKLLICANQGHSFEVEDPLLELITDTSKYPIVIHGTNIKCWNSIKKTGLSKMNRIHIHCAPGEPGTEGVISGMRRSAEIFIYVNISKAVQDGIKFYRSRNNVILTSGNAEGLLESKYFTKVVNVKTKEILSCRVPTYCKALESGEEHATYEISVREDTNRRY